MEYSAKMVASGVVSIFNGSAPGANTAILATGLRPSHTASAYRITVALTTSSVLNVTCTDGTTPHKWGLNASAALNAADLYTFTFAVRSTDDGLSTGTNLTYNFEVETDSVIECLFVEEVTGAVL